MVRYTSEEKTGRDSEMKTIVVDSTPSALEYFTRLSEEIEDIRLMAKFENAWDAMEYTVNNNVDCVFMEVREPKRTALNLVKKLRARFPEILIVFVSQESRYMADANKLCVDYYLLKPYTKETLRYAASLLKLLARRLQKEIQIQTFGGFSLQKNHEPVLLSKKPKECLALLVAACGNEISKRRMHEIIWSSEEYGDKERQKLYSVLRRMNQTLEAYGLKELVISTSRSLRINTKMFDCDYYAWLVGDAPKSTGSFKTFLPEYAWRDLFLPFNAASQAKIVAPSEMTENA